MIKISEIDYSKWTVKQLREFCKENDLKVASKARKADIVKLVNEFVAQSSSSPAEAVEQPSSQEIDVENEVTIEQSKVEPDLETGVVEESEVISEQSKVKSDLAVEEDSEEELEEELIAGFDEEDDPALLYKDKMDLKFWQKPEFRVLLDVELAKDSKAAFYDLSGLIDNFFSNMLKEDLINYKISGIALKSAAQLHHYKISSIIRQEEIIQKKEELEKLRERHSRTIPKALPQPIQPKMQIATKEELFSAMRSAIIETMQKKEKLKRRRERRDEIKDKKIKMKSKARLPKELLKHISGKEQTVDELHETWLNRIKGDIKLNSKTETSIFELMQLIKHDEKGSIGRRFALVRMFLALMFLSTGGASGTGKTTTDITLFQDDDFKDILVTLK